MVLFKYAILQQWFILFALLPGLFLAGCNPQEKKAAPPPQYRIGVLLGVNVFLSTVEGFKAGLAEKGYKEGENVTYDVQSVDGDETRMQEISDQFVAQDVDLILAITSKATQIAAVAAKKASIPLVFANTMNPVASGIIKSYNQPEAGVTGVYSRLDDYIGKRLEILKTLSPEVKSVWIPHNPAYSTAPRGMASLRKAAEQLDLNLIATEVKTSGDVAAALKAFKTVPFDSIMIFPDTTVQKAAAWEAMRSFASEHRLPLVANNRKQVEQGALFTYRYLNYDAGRLAADLAQRMLEGGRETAIPNIKTQPHLIINIKTAAQIGLEIDPVLLNSAGDVIR